MATESSQHAAVLSESLYDKPRRKHLRSQHNRCSDDSKNWTPFRSVEKKYMVKFPPPDLSEVLDLALLDEERKDEVDKGKWKGRADAFETREIELKEGGGSRRRRAFCVPMIPGLVILPGYLDEGTQSRLVRWSLSEHARKPNETNLDAHYKIPEEGIWTLHVHSDTRPIPRQMLGSPLTPDSPFEGATHSEAPTHLAILPNQSENGLVTATKLLHKLRWANIGWFYNWSTKQYEFERGKVDVGVPVRSLCKEIVRSINWRAVFNREPHVLGGRIDYVDDNPEWKDWDSSYEPDAGIVNFYQYRDTLMGHVDRAEVCTTSPLVSLSLGNAAVFLIGGLTKEERPVAILLRSGDAVVMAGPSCRRVYHGVPRILEGTLPQHFARQEEPSSDWAAYSQYLQSTRINVNVRQVFPKHYDPSASLNVS